jgi:hypothetical protein
VEIKFYGAFVLNRRVVLHARPPRHRRDACSMALRCRFITTRRSQHGRVIAVKCPGDTPVDFHAGADEIWDERARSEQRAGLSKE